MGLGVSLLQLDIEIIQWDRLPLEISISWLAFEPLRVLKSDLYLLA